MKINFVLKLLIVLSIPFLIGGCFLEAPEIIPYPFTEVKINNPGRHFVPSDSLDIKCVSTAHNGGWIANIKYGITQPYKCVEFPAGIVRDTFLLAGLEAGNLSVYLKATDNDGNSTDFPGSVKLIDPIVQDSFMDFRDSEFYSSSKIGEQIWMADNLRYDTLNFSFAPELNDVHIKAFGLLYKPEVVCEVCPSGWHLPTLEEIEKLVEYLRSPFWGDRITYSLCARDSLYWDDPNRFSNKTEFSAKGAGQIQIENNVPTDLGLMKKEMHFIVAENQNCESMIFYSVRIRLYNEYLHIEEIEQTNLTYSVRCIKN